MVPQASIRVGVVVAGLLAVVTSIGGAHDFWLVPDAFAVTPGGRMTVRGQTSSVFPTSLSAVTPDRIVGARVLTATTDVRVADVAVRGTSLHLGHRPATRGQHVIGVQLAPRTVRESPASFRHYLDIEGAPEARLRYEREGLLPPVGGDSITRRYAKYAKSFVEVGKGARAFERTFGHPLEFIPLSDPSMLRAGDTLRLRLMLLGRPATGARLHAGSIAAGPTMRTDTAAARRAMAGDVSLETDSAGVVSVIASRAGTWNVRTIQIVPAIVGSGADWDVHWATIVFSVNSAGAPRARQPSGAADSAAALAAVTQYEAALVRGDSASAVSLLASDLIVLESGSIETRAEYLAHHLGADIKASAGAKGERTVVKVSVIGDVAYVITKTVRPPTGAQGSTGSELAELMVLSRISGDWKIRAIHWSSRRRRT